MTSLDGAGKAYSRHRKPCVSVAGVGGGAGAALRVLGENTGYSPIYSTFNKCLLSTYCAAGIVLHTTETSVNKTGDVFIFMEVVGEKKERKKDGKYWEQSCLR